MSEPHQIIPTVKIELSLTKIINPDNIVITPPHRATNTVVFVTNGIIKFGKIANIQYETVSTIVFIEYASGTMYPVKNVTHYAFMPDYPHPALK